jgi:hypothetical protein
MSKFFFDGIIVLRILHYDRILFDGLGVIKAAILKYSRHLPQNLRWINIIRKTSHRFILKMCKWMTLFLVLVLKDESLFFQLFQIQMWISCQLR